MSMVDVAPDGTLWIAERCGANDCLANGDVDPILHVGASGEWLGAFGSNLFAWPHGVYVDAGGNVWVTDARGGDDRGHQVIKFAPNGRELLRLGTSATPATGRRISTAHRRRRRAERRRVRQRRPRADVEQPHREVLGGRPLHQGMGRQRQRDRASSSFRTRSRSTPGAALRRRPRQQSDSDLRSGRKLLEQWTQFGRPSGIHIAADDTLYVSDNQSNDERHPGWPRGIYVGSAKDGTVQRVHSGSRVRSGSRARDRRARPGGRRRRHDLRRRGLFAERQEVRALTRRRQNAAASVER